MHCYAWLCMVMHGYACYAWLCMLCMAMHCYTWLCIVMHGYALLCMAMYCYAWLCNVMHGYAMLCMAMHCYAWLCIVMHGYESLCMAMNLYYYKNSILFITQFQALIIISMQLVRAYYVQIAWADEIVLHFIVSIHSIQVIFADKWSKETFYQLSYWSLTLHT
jgi:hypothetical protein